MQNCCVVKLHPNALGRNKLLYGSLLRSKLICADRTIVGMSSKSVTRLWMTIDPLIPSR